METSEDKQWAAKYLLDPLNAPEPAEETGPGTSLIAQSQPVPTSAPKKLQKNDSIRSSAPSSESRKAPSVSVRSSNNPYRNGTSSYPTPPHSAGPTKSRFSDTTESFPDFDGSYAHNRQSVASSQIPTSTNGHGSSTSGGRNRRSSSLRERYPGDQSNHPLDIIRKDSKKAYRSPHLRKKHHPGADSIDKLDDLFPTGAYHHEGPYDATLLARNTSYESSPIEAVTRTNEEALKATPREMVKDSVEKHRPLDGTAIVPPGMQDRYGHRYDYEEGTDMMRQNNPEGGSYKRWPGLTYDPNDLKGKSEPSYTIEKALKQHKAGGHGRHVSEGGIEMVVPTESRPPISAEGGARRVSADGGGPTSAPQVDRDGHVRRSSSGAGRLRKRFGSLRVGKNE